MGRFGPNCSPGSGSFGARFHRRTRHISCSFSHEKSWASGPVSKLDVVMRNAFAPYGSLRERIGREDEYPSLVEKMTIRE